MTKTALLLIFSIFLSGCASIYGDNNYESSNENCNCVAGEVLATFKEEPNESGIKKTLPLVTAAEPQRVFLHGRKVFKLKFDKKIQVADMIRKLKRSGIIEFVQPNFTYKFGDSE